MIRFTDQQGHILWQLLEKLEGHANQKALSDQIRDQLEHPHHTDDLIDIMAMMVGPDVGHGVLNKATVQHLRNAFLRPSELAALKHHIDTTVGCVRCGEELVAGELGCFHDQQPFCMRCVMPTIMTCPHCHMKKSLPTGIARVIQKVIKECTTCAALKAEAHQPAEPAAAAEPAVAAEPAAAMGPARQWDPQRPLMYAPIPRTWVDEVAPVQGVNDTAYTLAVYRWGPQPTRFETAAARETPHAIEALLRPGREG